MEKVNVEVLLDASRIAQAKDAKNSQNAVSRKVAEISLLPSLIVGRVASLLESGQPLVDFPGNTTGALVPARSLVSVVATTVGGEVALSFEDGDPSLPIIVGILQSHEPIPVSNHEVKLDDESLVLSAKKEVVIQCGKSSITLTSAGKVLIRGAYLLSRSSGVNRIKGGSVQIN